MNVVRSIWRCGETPWCSSTSPVGLVSSSAQTPLAKLFTEACCDGFSGTAAVTAAAIAGTAASVDFEARTDQARCSRSPCSKLHRDVAVAVAATASPLMRVIVLTAAAAAAPMAVGLRTGDDAFDFGDDHRGAASHYYSNDHRQYRGDGISQNLSLLQMQQSLVGDDEMSDYYTEYTGDVHVVAPHAHSQIRKKPMGGQPQQRQPTEKDPALSGQPPTDLIGMSFYPKNEKRFDPSLGEIAVERRSGQSFHDRDPFTTSVPGLLDAYSTTEITTTAAAADAGWEQADPSFMMQTTNQPGLVPGNGPTPNQIWEATRNMEEYALSAEEANMQMERAFNSLVAPGAAGRAPSTLEALMPALASRMASHQIQQVPPTPAPVIQTPAPTPAPSTPTTTAAPRPAPAPVQQAPAQAPEQAPSTSLPCDCNGDVSLPVDCQDNDLESRLRAEIDDDRTSDLATLHAQVTAQIAENAKKVSRIGRERRRRWRKQKTHQKRKKEKRKKEKKKKEAKKAKMLRKERATRASKAAARKALVQATPQAPAAAAPPPQRKIAPGPPKPKPAKKE